MHLPPLTRDKLPKEALLLISQQQALPAFLLPTMDSEDPNNNHVAHDVSPYCRILKDGSIERLIGTDHVPPSLDSHTGVTSKDITISSELGVTARLYLPKLNETGRKLPLLIYFHGGGFLIFTPSSSVMHNHLNSLVAEANIVAVSVAYRLAPEHHLPIAYEDSWAAVEWVASNKGGGGLEPWLADHVDFDRVFLGGDSAGANIAHNIAMRVQSVGLPNEVRLLGLALMHPYFWGSEAIGVEISSPEARSFLDYVWRFVYPSSSGSDDPCINPVGPRAPSLSGLGCSRVLVCVAERDVLRYRGWLYYETLGKSGWAGEVEIFESEGEEHDFHILGESGESTVILIKRIAAFLNDNHAASMLE